MAAFASTLQAYETTFIDVLLLHYAACWGSLCDGKQPAGTWKDSWRALEQLVKDGKVLAIGAPWLRVARLEAAPQMWMLNLELLLQG